MENGHAHILLVDDEESLRLTLSANFEMEGFEVIEAESAAEALQILRDGSTRVDLVLSDVRMPGMTGVEFFLELKQSHPQLPVILMTAFSSESSVQQAIAGGVFTVLSKPFDIEKIVHVLQSALRNPMVLVVDDDESVAVSTAEALRASGVKAGAVFDGEAAIQTILDGQSDVCVTDLAMPKINGAELARRAKKFDESIVIIVFSGASSSETLMREAAAAGAFQCFRKPVDTDKLVQSIANARGGRTGDLR